jgi:hypothetical protein
VVAVIVAVVAFAEVTAKDGTCRVGFGVEINVRGMFLKFGLVLKKSPLNVPLVQ